MTAVHTRRQIRGSVPSGMQLLVREYPATRLSLGACSPSPYVFCMFPPLCDHVLQSQSVCLGKRVLAESPCTMHFGVDGYNPDIDVLSTFSLISQLNT